MVWNRTSSVIGLDPRIHVPTTRFGFVGIDHDTWPAKANPRREGDRARKVKIFGRARILRIEGLMGVRASESQAISVEKPAFGNGLPV